MSLGPILYLVAKYQMSSGPHGPIFLFGGLHHPPHLDFGTSKKKQTSQVSDNASRT